MQLRFSFSLLATMAASFLSAPVAADVLPGSVMPEQVAKSLQPRPSVTPAPTSQPTVIQPVKQPGSVSAEQQKIKFKLNDIQLIGNHVYSRQQLLPLFRKQLHQTISVADLFKIVENITNFYRNNGYILSFATLPPQRGKGGIIKIQIVEGYIANVSVTGKPRGAKCLVEGFGYRVRKCPPLNIDPLRKYMLLVNEIPGVTAKAVLGPAKTGLGAADLFMDTATQLFSAYFSYDNYGTRYIGPQQMTGNVTVFSLINSGDSTSATFTKTPKGGELTFLDINYNAPLSDNGTRWILGDTRVHTHPLFVLQPTQTDGFNSNLYMTIIYPYIRTRAESLNLTAGFNYLDSNTTIFDTNLYTDHIRSLDFGFNYNFADRFYGSNMINFNFRKGLPIWGYSADTDQFTATTSRPGGYAAYTKVGAQYSRLQAVTSRISILAVAKGQWAFVPLLSSEQYTFGGNPIGRGYDPAELIGDRGASGSLELRYDMAFNSMINSVQLYSFYDVGSIWNILVNASSPTKVSAASAGLGARFTMTKYISGNVMWTKPLSKQVAAEELIGRGWRPRTFVSIVCSFN